MLRRASGYCLLLLYLTVAFKPLLPAVQDAWEHAFNEAEHLSTVHAHGGDHHLQKEMAEDHDDDHHDQNDHTLKAEDEVPFHLLAAPFTLDFGIEKDGGRYFLPPLSRLTLVIIACPSPPPKEGFSGI